MIENSELISRATKRYKIAVKDQSALFQKEGVRVTNDFIKNGMLNSTTYIQSMANLHSEELKIRSELAMKSLLKIMEFAKKSISKDNISAIKLYLHQTLRAEYDYLLIGNKTVMNVIPQFPKVRIWNEALDAAFDHEKQRIDSELDDMLLANQNHAQESTKESQNSVSDKKNVSLIKRIWNDPVWSKVIAGGILAVFSLLVVYIRTNEHVKKTVQTSSPSLAAVTLENSGDLTLQHNDINGPDKLAELKNSGNADVAYNKLNAQQQTQALLSPSVAPSDDNSAPKQQNGLIVNGTTFIGKAQLIEGNVDGKPVTIENVHSEANESRFFTFPPPTGEFNTLSAIELKKHVSVLASDLEANETYDNQLFKQKFLPQTLSLASELMARLKDVQIPDGPNNKRKQSDIKWGRIIILDGKLSGPLPMHCVASFLLYLADQLPKQ